MKIARRFFHLPYEHAEMRSSRTTEGRIRYGSLRIATDRCARAHGPTGRRADGSRCVFDDAAGADLPGPKPGSLEFFLVERYRLYSHAPDGLRRGAVFHGPYPLCSAVVAAWDENLLPLDGFAPTGRPPDEVLWSDDAEKPGLFAPTGDDAPRSAVPKVSPAFLDIARSVAAHDDVRRSTLGHPLPRALASDAWR